MQGLAPFIPAVELHHENWDGTGYPRGQTGEATPVEARIIHVSDAYDAMTTDRSYRSGLTHERAIEILREYAGTQFDPHIVEVFTQLPRDLVLADQSTHQPPDEFTGNSEGASGHMKVHRALIVVVLVVCSYALRARRRPPPA